MYADQEVDILKDQMIQSIKPNDINKSLLLIEKNFASDSKMDSHSNNLNSILYKIKNQVLKDHYSSLSEQTKIRGPTSQDLNIYSSLPMDSNLIQKHSRYYGQFDKNEDPSDKAVFLSSQDTGYHQAKTNNRTLKIKNDESCFYQSNGNMNNKKVIGLNKEPDCQYDPITKYFQFNQLTSDSKEKFSYSNDDKFKMILKREEDFEDFKNKEIYHRPKYVYDNNTLNSNDDSRTLKKRELANTVVNTGILINSLENTKDLLEENHNSREKELMLKNIVFQNKIIINSLQENNLDKKRGIQLVPVNFSPEVIKKNLSPNKNAGPVAAEILINSTNNKNITKKPYQKKKAKRNRISDYIIRSRSPSPKDINNQISSINNNLELNVDTMQTAHINKSPNIFKNTGKISINSNSQMTQNISSKNNIKYKRPSLVISKNCSPVRVINKTSNSSVFNNLENLTKTKNRGGVVSFNLIMNQGRQSKKGHNLILDNNYCFNINKAQSKRRVDNSSFRDISIERMLNNAVRNIQKIWKRYINSKKNACIRIQSVWRANNLRKRLKTIIYQYYCWQNKVVNLEKLIRFKKLQTGFVNLAQLYNSFDGSKGKLATQVNLSDVLKVILDLSANKKKNYNLISGHIKSKNQDDRIESVSKFSKDTNSRIGFEKLNLEEENIFNFYFNGKKVEEGKDKNKITTKIHIKPKNFTFIFLTKNFDTKYNLNCINKIQNRIRKYLMRNLKISNLKSIIVKNEMKMGKLEDFKILKTLIKSQDESSPTPNNNNKLYYPSKNLKRKITLPGTSLYCTKKNKSLLFINLLTKIQKKWKKCLLKKRLLKDMKLFHNLFENKKLLDRANYIKAQKIPQVVPLFSKECKTNYASKHLIKVQTIIKRIIKFRLQNRNSILNTSYTQKSQLDNISQYRITQLKWKLFAKKLIENYKKHFLMTK